MKSSQIIVRSKMIGFLENYRHAGIYHGKFLLASAEEVEAEIKRREKIKRPEVFLTYFR